MVNSDAMGKEHGIKKESPSFSALMMMVMKHEGKPVRKVDARDLRGEWGHTVRIHVSNIVSQPFSCPSSCLFAVLGYLSVPMVSPRPPPPSLRSSRPIGKPDQRARRRDCS